MQPGEHRLDTRDSSVVQLLEVYETNPGVPGLAKVMDIPKGFTFFVETRHLSPRVIDPDSILVWLKHP